MWVKVMDLNLFGYVLGRLLPSLTPSFSISRKGRNAIYCSHLFTCQTAPAWVVPACTWHAPMDGCLITTGIGGQARPVRGCPCVHALVIHPDLQ